MTEVMSQVSAVKSELPSEAEDPVITKAAGTGVSLMYLSFFSDTLAGPQITDYVDRVVRPKLATAPGVASVQLLGSQTFAMRVWLDPEAMAQRGLTAAAVMDALVANNFQAAAGSLKGYYDTIDIKAGTTLADPAQFENLVIKTSDSGPVRLRDIAEVTLAAETTNTRVLADGREALFVGIDGTPDSNSLSVVEGIYKVLPEIEANLPPAIQMKMNYDSTMFIEESIQEVAKTLAEAAIIGDPGDSAVHGVDPFGDHSDGDDSAVVDRRRHRHAGARLHHQSAHPVGVRACHRSGGGTTPSSWSRTCTAISRRATRRSMRRSSAPARSPGR